LVSNGADVNVKYIDGWTPLHSAVMWNHIDIVKILINYGANINSKADAIYDYDYNTKKWVLIGEGWNSLHIVLYKWNVDIAKLLIEKGADISQKADVVYSHEEI
jgi:ankyrin repeat protein